MMINAGWEKDREVKASTIFNSVRNEKGGSAMTCISTFGESRSKRATSAKAHYHAPTDNNRGNIV
jgi:hypothetical protein